MERIIAPARTIFKLGAPRLRALPVTIPAVMPSRLALLLGLLTMLASSRGFGGEPAIGQTQAAATAAATPWAYSLSGYYFALPNASDYFVGIAAANRGPLRLEARYNYENIDAGSVFAGWNVAAGERLRISVTPMLGLVFGTTRGIAPGVEIGVQAAPFDFYFEGEYVFDWRGARESFFYAWSELAATPVAWLRTGFVAQRTAIDQSDRELQLGGFVQLLLGRINLGAYLFNPGSSDWFFATGVELGF
jgi:hypothetical protein